MNLEQAKMLIASSQRLFGKLKYSSFTRLHLPKYNSFFYQEKKHAVFYHSRLNKRAGLLNNLSLSFYSTNKKVSFLSEGPYFNISTGVYSLSKNEEAKKGKICTPLECGEDSFSIAENENEIVLAVADGVGGWRSEGIDPSVFAQTLMHHVGEISRSPNENLKTDEERPRTIIHDAFCRLVEDFKTGRKKPLGSSTACVVMIDRETGKLKFGNLGDSGFVLMSQVESAEGHGKKYRIKFKSQSQQYSFDYPVQITLMPKDDRTKDTTHLTITDSSIKPKVNLSIRMDDIVLVMTDGVLDNLFDHELEKLVTSSFKKHSKKFDPKNFANLIAQDVALKARQLSENSKRFSPFTSEAEKIGYSDYLGGKKDDITVVAGIMLSKKEKY